MVTAAGSGNWRIVASCIAGRNCSSFPTPQSSSPKARKTPIALPHWTVRDHASPAESGQAICVKALARRDVIILEDNDDARDARRRSRRRRIARHGEDDPHRFAAGPARQGRRIDWLDADPQRAEKLADVCFDVPVWPISAAPTGHRHQHRESANTETTDQSLPFINIAAGRISQRRSDNGR